MSHTFKFTQTLTAEVHGIDSFSLAKNESRYFLSLYAGNTHNATVSVENLSELPTPVKDAILQAWFKEHKAPVNIMRTPLK